MISLLDVNVLLAIAWPNNTNHASATAWFEEAQEDGWATCVITEAGFTRISCNQTVVQHRVTPREALGVLSDLIARPNHTFLPLDQSLTPLPPAIRDRLTGAGQITDAILLAAAIRHNCQLATFDAGLTNLVPAQNSQSLQVIPP